MCHIVAQYVQQQPARYQNVTSALHMWHIFGQTPWGKRDFVKSGRGIKIILGLVKISCTLVKNSLSLGLEKSEVGEYEKL